MIPLNIWDSFLGLLDTLMQPIYWAISGILVGGHSLWASALGPTNGWSWVLSIITLTVVIRTLMIPLFVKQINSSRKMQLMGPKTKALQEKYGHDRELLGQKTMEMYREEGVNPAASCLPLLVQMPIFIGLFTVLNNASRGVATGFFFQEDTSRVSSLQNAEVFGAKISGMLMQPGQPLVFDATFWLSAFLIISMTATLFITQLQLMRKNMPPESLEGPMAQQQKMMLYLFPAIYLVTGISIPIGVMIYWLASNLWTLAQQYILIHNNPTPNTPAFIDWEERMRAKGKDPQAILAKRMGPSRKRPAPAADPGTVARQGKTRTTSTPASEASDSAADQARQRVQRQQPTKGTRSNRKQAKPRQTGESPKE